MIIEVNKDDIDILKDTFVDIDYISHEFEVNPFAKVLILKEKEVIGYLYYSDIYDRIEINQIEIEINNRNCGKGHKLLKELTTSVDKNITLEVNQNNIPAIKLYEKNGFEKKAIRVGYYDGVDGILMERKII